MKKTNKIIASITALALLIPAITPLGNVFAASAPTWADDIDSMTINRQIQNAYGSINNTFTYTITADSTNPSGATGLPSAPSIAYNESYSSQQTATKSAEIDFSGMRFDRAGNYYYTIKEADSTNASLFPVDRSNSYKALIAVQNTPDMSGFTASLLLQDAEGHKLSTFSGADSEVVFASTPAYTNIQITEKVAGNAADTNKCFEYRLTFNTSDSYVVSTESTCENPDSVSNNSIIKLKHNDTMTIGLVRAGSQIPVGTNYSIAKVDTSDGYTTKMDGATHTSISKTMAATGTDAYNTANKTNITEELSSTVDTGAVMNIAIYVLLALAGAVGVYYVARKKSAKKA